MGCGKECGVSLVIGPVSCAIGLFAVPQLRGQLVVRVRDRDAPGQIRKVGKLLVLVVAKGIARRRRSVPRSITTRGRGGDEKVAPCQAFGKQTIGHTASVRSAPRL